MKKIVYLLVLSGCLIMSHTFAQNTSDGLSAKPSASSKFKFTFAAQPLQLANWCLRHDIEIRIGEGPGWLQFGPSLYFSIIGGVHTNKPKYYYSENDYHYRYNQDPYENSNLREPFSQLTGGGLDVNYKRFFDRSFYLATGLSYTSLKIEYWGRTWDDYTEDGFQYHTYELDYRIQHINRLGINAFFGYQMPFKRGGFLLDAFIGFAYRLSFSDKERYSFNKYIISYGYTGLVPLAGVRVGFGVR